MSSIADFIESLAGLNIRTAGEQCRSRLIEELKSLQPMLQDLACFSGLPKELALFEQAVSEVIQAFQLEAEGPNILPRLQSCRDCEKGKDEKDKMKAEKSFALKQKLNDLCMLIMYSEARKYIAFVKLAGSAGEYCRGTSSVRSGIQRGKYVGAN